MITLSDTPAHDHAVNSADIELSSTEEKLLRWTAKSFESFFASLQKTVDYRGLQGMLLKTIHIWNNNTRSYAIPTKEVEEKSLSEFVQKHLSEAASSANPLFLTLKSVYFHIRSALLTEESDFPESLKAQFEWVAVRRDEMLRLLIERKRQQGNPVNCLVLEIDELPAILSAIQQTEAPLRLQLLVRNEVHYTAIDISLQADQADCAVMDAYGEDKAHLIEKVFQQSGYRVFTLGKEERIQLDQRSCSLFSLGHVFASSKDPRFFDNLAKISSYCEETGLHYVEWSDLPLKMIRTSQNQVVNELFKKKRGLSADAQTISHYFKNHGAECMLAKWTEKVSRFVASMGVADAYAIATKSPLSVRHFRNIS